MSNKLREIEALGQSIWIDNINRQLLEDGELERLIERGRHQRRDLEPDDLREGRWATRTATTTPSARRRRGRPTRGTSSRTSRCATSATPPTCCAPSSTRPTGQDGYVSFELPPELAFDAQGSVETAEAPAASAIGKANVLIKVPGTEEGVRGVRGADGARRHRQRDAAVLRRRATARSPRPTSAASSAASRPASRSTASPPWRASSSRAWTPRSTPSSSELGRADLRGKAARRQRADRLRGLRARSSPGERWERARAGRGARAAAAVGVDLDQEPRLPGHALRGRADRPGHRQHDARRDDRGRARPRHAGAHGRQGRRRAPTRHGRAARGGRRLRRHRLRQLVDEGVESFAKSFDSLIETIERKASELAGAAREAAVDGTAGSGSGCGAGSGISGAAGGFGLG